MHTSPDMQREHVADLGADGALPPLDGPDCGPPHGAERERQQARLVRRHRAGPTGSRLAGRPVRWARGRGPQPRPRGRPQHAVHLRARCGRQPGTRRCGYRGVVSLYLPLGATLESTSGDPPRDRADLTVSEGGRPNVSWTSTCRRRQARYVVLDLRLRPRPAGSYQLLAVPSPRVRPRRSCARRPGVAAPRAELVVDRTWPLPAVGSPSQGRQPSSAVSGPGAAGPNFAFRPKRPRVCSGGRSRCWGEAGVECARSWKRPTHRGPFARRRARTTPERPAGLAGRRPPIPTSRCPRCTGAGADRRERAQRPSAGRSDVARGGRLMGAPRRSDLPDGTIRLPGDAYQRPRSRVLSRLATSAMTSTAKAKTERAGVLATAGRTSETCSSAADAELVRRPPQVAVASPRLAVLEWPPLERVASDMSRVRAASSDVREGLEALAASVSPCVPTSATVVTTTLTGHSVKLDLLTTDEDRPAASGMAAPEGDAEALSSRCWPTSNRDGWPFVGASR